MFIDMFLLLGFVSDDLNINQDINITITKLHGFLANDSPDEEMVRTLALKVCCRQDGDPQTVIRMPFGVPFLLVKVNYFV